MQRVPKVRRQTARTRVWAQTHTYSLALRSMGPRHDWQTAKILEGGHVYLLVAVDKFTKWIEAMPVTNQKGKTAVKFFESIVYRFGVPHSIITDNGSNFISKEF